MKISNVSDKIDTGALIGILALAVVMTLAFLIFTPKVNPTNKLGLGPNKAKIFNQQFHMDENYSCSEKPDYYLCTMSKGDKLYSVKCNDLGCELVQDK